MIIRTAGLLAIATLLAAAGPSDPQTVEGPCQVKQFFIVALTTSNTDMTIDGNGQACTFTVINPNIQAVQSAALVTTPAAHGRAEAGLILGGTSAVIRYTPAPGYTGTDRFTTTVEPGDKAIIVSVTVNAAR